MVGLGWTEILILLACAGLFLGSPLLVGLLYVAAQRSGRSRSAPHPEILLARGAAARPNDPANGDSHLEIVARLTQRFCPQCRSTLGTDAPEGLCAACLMAGAIGTPRPAALQEGGGLDPELRMAVTTPPSGSRPPVAGEIGNLQQHFSQLEILELLGRGGMGAVYKARQKNLDRLVAIKVIPPDAAKDPAFAERFAREARAMARLNHPNIVTVYDYGEAGGTFWLLMEYVDGLNLRQTLRAGRLSPAEALAIVPPVCDALQYAHDQGVVHRDIKPENVLLDRTGRVKIADFGLAKLLGKGPDDFTLTHTQQVMGTPRYMAPEQIEKPTSVDHRADIYSLGVMIYEMLTGELPLGRFALPSERAGVDTRIDQVVLRALEKEPDRRYQRASQVKTELASAGSGPAAGAMRQHVEAGIGFGEVPAPHPTWHTPAHATKSEIPGGVPLGQVLVVAFGMVLGVLMMGGGLAALAYGLYYSFRGQVDAGLVGGWLGGGFGCLLGGFGSAAGSYNTYRQMSGAEDLLQSPRTTWFDWIMRGYLLLGLILLVTGLTCWEQPKLSEFSYPLMLLGSIASFQAALFLVWRGIAGWYGVGRAAPVGVSAGAVDPHFQHIRRRVAGPAIGLMIAGAIGLLPIVAAIILVPAVVVTPSLEPVRNDLLETRLVALETGECSWLGLLVREIICRLAPAPAAISLPVLLGQRAEQTILAIAFPLVALAYLINFAFSMTLIVGGWRMRKLRSYGLAIAASWLAVLPCTLGWILGLPMGIWAIVTLQQPEVRAMFDREPE